MVKIHPTRYRDRHPIPEEIYLLIEVADSTLSHDRNRKIKVYAKANISEYWVIDVNQRRLLVFRQPQGDTYQIEQVLSVMNSIAPVAFPEVVIELSNLLV